ncbi:aminotransferase class III-fold pyridoxal phosphate-dependent enzyme [Sorangium sp. So ce327]|uniref:type I polyketide synthase n=1 Tax=Sorangium sp. So ce327 TaxID=3133301 RepID=UPI003F627DC2
MTAADDKNLIAVVGMSCRLPGARDAAQFWENLRDGVESISFFQREELIAAGVPPHLVDAPGYVPAAGALEGADLFDAEFFGLTPREAELLDPQHRIFLEHAWELLDRTGHGAEGRDEVVGVYAAADFNSYLVHNLLPHYHRIGAGSGTFQALLASDKDYLTTRVSYKLNLVGPSITVQTACSASLVAVHLACQALLAGECDLALAGGVSITVPLKAGYLYQPGIVSPDGHCRAFDHRAGGTVGGNGVGIVLLARLADALAAGNQVLAIIRGTAVNNDGSDKVGYTAPSVRAQARVVAEAMSVARVEPDSISHVEAHGTGTRLGDPIEVEALTQAYRRKTSRTGFCALGSVKTNIGHLNAAAGVAGLIKTVLALRHRMIPPSLHFERPNPEIPLESSPFFVNDRLRPWTAEGPRRAGVSSFGIGGTNAHVIVEEWTDPLRSEASSRQRHALILSAKSEAALRALCADMAGFLEAHPEVDVADAAFSLSVGRTAHAHRRAVLCRTSAEAVAALREPRGGPSVRVSGSPGPVLLFFPGDAAAAARIARLFDRRCDPLHAHLTACAELLASELGIALPGFAPGAAPCPARGVDGAARDRAASFALAWALGQLWLDCGLQPDQVAGSGVGEIVAAVVRGEVSLEEGLRRAASADGSVEGPSPDLPPPQAHRSWLVVCAGAADRPAGSGVDSWLPSLASAGAGGAPDDSPLLDGLVKLWMEGVPVLVHRYYDGEKRLRVELPIHPLRRERHWLRPDPEPPPAEGSRRAKESRVAEHVESLIARLTARTGASRRLAESHRSTHADNRSMVRFRSAWKKLCYPLVARRAEGSRLWDVDGNEYVDLTMGFGVNLFGHAPRFLRDALDRQLVSGMNCAPDVRSAGEVAERISAMTGVERVAFCNTGTEAVMLALRVARAVTGRDKVALFAGSYHGSYDGLLARSGLSGDRSITLPAVPGIPPRMIEDAIVLDYASPASVNAVRERAHELAAVLVEPIQSRRPDLVPKALLQDLRTVTRQAGVPLIFDEMITGFRIHPGGAQAWLGVEADLVTYGKVLGGGLPIGVVGGRADLLAAIDGAALRAFYDGTFCQHPLAMAAARAVLDELSAQGPALQENLNRRARDFTRRLDAILTELRAPLRVASFGSFFNFAFQGAAAHAELLLGHLIEQGVYVWEGGTCFVSTAHSDADLDRVASALEAGVGAMRQDGLL